VASVPKAAARPEQLQGGRQPQGPRVGARSGSGSRPPHPPARRPPPRATSAAERTPPIPARREGDPEEGMEHRPSWRARAPDRRRAATSAAAVRPERAPAGLRSDRLRPPAHPRPAPPPPGPRATASSMRPRRRCPRAAPGPSPAAGRSDPPALDAPGARYPAAAAGHVPGVRGAAPRRWRPSPAGGRRRVGRGARRRHRDPSSGRRRSLPRARAPCRPPSRAALGRYPAARCSRSGAR